ncbi:hypothetical protein DFH11DRAFT_1595497 [Phellopilus nigrolimitatus]|nr:hypothetical protein DFH11DRAFT_1595497 [Phellopilus nigrolimitatus]
MPHEVVDFILPAVHTTLAQFVETAMHLGDGKGYEKHDDLAAAQRFVHYAMTGQHPDLGNQAYISLNNYVPNAGQYFTVRRDYDSIIGLSRTLPFNVSVGMWVFPNFDDCLRKNNHVSATVWKDGQVHRVSLAHIPNFGFCSAGERQITRLYFPALWNGRHTVPKVRSKIPSLLYDNVTLPVRRLVLPDSHTPTSYKAESFRCTRNKGTYVFTKYDIPADSLAAFTREFLAQLDQQSYGVGAFFHHEIRGVKGRTYHDPANDEDAENALRSASEMIDGAAIFEDNSEWFVDVAVEVGSPGHVGLFRKDTHYLILKRLLGMDTETAVAKVRSPTFDSDTAVMLSEAAGFRTGHDGSDRNGTIYLNVYHTEKSPTYLVDEGHYAKFNTASSVLKLITGGATEMESMEKIDNVFSECRDVAHGFPARMEARVPLRNAVKAHRAFDQDFLRNILYLVPNEVHWEAKMTRQRAFKMIIEWMMDAPRPDLATQQALTLLVVVVFMSNALCAKPELGAKYDNLMRAILPFRADEVTLEDVPHNPFGMLFVRGIYLGGQCPELRDGRMITPENLAKFFDQASQTDVQDNIMSNGSNSHIRRTTEGDYVADSEPLFHLERKGITFPPLKLVVEGMEDEMIEGYEGPELSTDHTATKIYLQMPICYTQKCRTGSRSSLTTPYRITAEEATPDLFRRTDLHNIFSYLALRKNYEKTHGGGQWDTTFKWVFPEFGQKECDSIQGYHHMSYFQWYKKLKEACEERGDGRRTLDAFRAELKILFGTFKWFPLSVSDRPYNARNSKGAIVYPKTHTGPAPLILFNPLYKAEMQAELPHMTFRGIA